MKISHHIKHQKWILDEEKDVGVCVGWNFENRCYAEKNDKFSKIFYLKFWYLASLTCLKTMKDFRKKQPTQMSKYPNSWCKSHFNA